MNIWLRCKSCGKGIELRETDPDNSEDLNWGSVPGISFARFADHHINECQGDGEFPILILEVNPEGAANDAPRPPAPTQAAQPVALPVAEEVAQQDSVFETVYSIYETDHELQPKGDRLGICLSEEDAKIVTEAKGQQGHTHEREDAILIDGEYHLMQGVDGIPVAEVKALIAEAEEIIREKAMEGMTAAQRLVLGVDKRPEPAPVAAPVAPVALAPAPTAKAAAPAAAPAQPAEEAEDKECMHCNRKIRLGSQGWFHVDPGQYMHETLPKGSTPHAFKEEDFDEE